MSSNAQRWGTSVALCLFVKEAATVNQLQGAYRRLGAIRIPRSATQPGVGRLSNAPATISNPRQMARPLSALLDPAHQAQAIAAIRANAPANINGKIFMPPGGAVKAVPRYLEQAFGGTAYAPKPFADVNSPDGKRAVNVLTGVHEGFERSVKPNEIGAYGSHMSPGVLLKEHNALAKLTGPGADEARQGFQRMRSTVGESQGLDQLFKQRYPNYNFSFGQGDKIPKAMRKNFTTFYQGMVDQRMRDAMKDAGPEMQKGIVEGLAARARGGAGY